MHLSKRSACQSFCRARQSNRLSRQSKRSEHQAVLRWQPNSMCVERLDSTATSVRKCREYVSLNPNRDGTTSKMKTSAVRLRRFFVFYMFHDTVSNTGIKIAVIF